MKDISIPESARVKYYREEKDDEDDDDDDEDDEDEAQRKKKKERGREEEDEKDLEGVRHRESARVRCHTLGKITSCNVFNEKYSPIIRNDLL